MTNKKPAQDISDKLDEIRTQLGSQMKRFADEPNAYDTETWRELDKAYGLISLARLKIRKVAELDYPGQSEA